MRPLKGSFLENYERKKLKFSRKKAPVRISLQKEPCEVSSYSGDWRDPNRGRLGNDCDKYALEENLSFPKIRATLFDFERLSYLTFNNKSCMADDLFRL